MNSLLTATSTSWPEAAIAIAGVALVGSIAVVVIWQALLTWRTRIAVTREQQYRALAEQTARDLAEIRERLGDAQTKDEEQTDDD
jgi:flagellar biosynthesis/type III secretory pathway M-ring protein FliF/YscJ